MNDVRVLVADDEPLARERVVSLVNSTPGLQLAGEAIHGLDALDQIVALRPDLVLLDVEMPELSGLDVVAALEDTVLPGIVFITAYDEYAIRAFEVNAIDYVLKPVTPERFAVTVERAISRLRADGASFLASAVRLATASLPTRPAYRTRFVVRRGARHTFVAVSDVVWIDAVDNYLQLHVPGRVHLVRATMKDAERELDPALFVRIHRSAIVNVAHIAAIDVHPAGGHLVRLTDGTTVRTSRQYATRVRALLAPFHR
ncbi:MAG: LytTR family DNA-binding domain-containing protein [Gemmatimonadaceae bacterium]